MEHPRKVTLMDTVHPVATLVSQHQVMKPHLVIHNQLALMAISHHPSMVVHPLHSYPQNAKTCCPKKFVDIFNHFACPTRCVKLLQVLKTKLIATYYSWKSTITEISKVLSQLLLKKEFFLKKQFPKSIRLH